MVSLSSANSSPYPSPVTLHLFLLLLWTSLVEPRAQQPKLDHQVLHELLNSNIASLLLTSANLAKRAAERSAPLTTNGCDQTQALSDHTHGPSLRHLYLTFREQQAKFKGRTKKRRNGGGAVQGRSLDCPL